MTEIQAMLPDDVSVAQWDDLVWDEMPATLDARLIGIEAIIQEARNDASGLRDGRWQAYEYHKRRLDMLWLGSELYEQACRNLATALGV